MYLSGQGTSIASIPNSTAYGSISIPTPRPQVEDQIDNLQMNAKDLSEIVARLTLKLSSVTNVQLSQNAKPAVTAPEQVLVPLASRLREVCSDVRGTVDHLRELCASIELSD